MVWSGDHFGLYSVLLVLMPGMLLLLLLLLLPLFQQQHRLRSSASKPLGEEPSFFGTCHYNPCNQRNTC